MSSSSILPPRSAAQQSPCHRYPPSDPSFLSTIHLLPPHVKSSPSSFHICKSTAKSTSKNKTHHSQARLCKVPHQTEPLTTNPAPDRIPSPKAPTEPPTPQLQETRPRSCEPFPFPKLRHFRSSSTARKPWMQIRCFISSLKTCLSRLSCRTKREKKVSRVRLPRRVVVPAGMLGLSGVGGFFRAWEVGGGVPIDRLR